MNAAIITAIEVGVAAMAMAAVTARLTATVRSPANASPPPRRRGGRSATDWAALLDHLAAEVRTGHSLTAAVQRVEQRSGINPNEADQSAHADAAVVTATIAAATAVGGPMAATLQHGASVLRERIALRAEAAVHAAQARLSAQVLTLLPLAVAGLGAFTSTSFRHALASPVGIGCATVGALLNLVGWRWMRREIERVLS